MRILIQRVSKASVTIDGEVVSSIGYGLLILVGVEDADSEEDARWLAAKAAKLRIFDDENGIMNLDVVQTGGEALVVSQFTLHASTKKGNRPSYIRAAKESLARPLYERFAELLERELGRKVCRGRFGADMKVALINDGPVSIWIDSQNKE